MPLIRKAILSTQALVARRAAQAAQAGGVHHRRSLCIGLRADAFIAELRANPALADELASRSDGNTIRLIAIKVRQRMIDDGADSNRDGAIDQSEFESWVQRRNPQPMACADHATCVSTPSVDPSSAQLAALAVQAPTGWKI